MAPRKNRKSNPRTPPKEQAGNRKTSRPIKTVQATRMVEEREPLLMSPSETASPPPERSLQHPIQPNLVFEGEVGAYTFMNMVVYNKIDIAKVKSLGFVLNQNEWSSRQDDFFAIALADFVYGHQLESLSIWIKGSTLFTHENFTLAAPNLASAYGVADIPTKYQQFQKVYEDKSTRRSLEEHPPPIVVSSKQMIDTVLRVQNIPSVRIEGPMETRLMEKIMATCQTPQLSDQTNDSQYLRRTGKEHPDGLQQVSASCMLDPIAYTPHLASPKTNIVKGYNEAIHLMLNFQQESRGLAISPNSVVESDTIADYLNLCPKEDAMKELSRDFVSSIYDEMVQESSSRFEPPFTPKKSRRLRINYPYYFGEPEAIHNANVGERSKKRKAEEMNGAQSPSKKRKADEIIGAESPSKPRKRGARVKFTFRRGEAPPSGEALPPIEQPPSGGAAPAGEASAPDEAPELDKVPEVDEAPAPKRVRVVETAAQKAFKNDRVEHRVLDVNKSGALERGALGEMVRLSKHLIPICSENLRQRNTEEERIATTYMTDAYLGWQLVRDPGTKDGFRVGRPDEVVDGVHTPRGYKPREYKPRENKPREGKPRENKTSETEPRVVAVAPVNSGRRRAGMRTRSGAGGGDGTKDKENGDMEGRSRGSPGTASVSSATATEKEASKCDSPGMGTPESIGESV